MKYFYLFILLTISFSYLICYEPFYVDDPAISPCGEMVTFVYMDNLWEVEFTGGIARRLTAGTDRIFKPAYSPCGSWILFNSDRDGMSKLYRLPTTGGPAELISNEQITFHDWYPDSQTILGSIRFPGEESAFVKLDFNGYRLIELAGISGSFASLSKDAKHIVFDRRGYPFRPAYEGSHNGDLWLYNFDTNDVIRLTDTPLTERYPKFSLTQPNRIYFVGSDSTHFQLYYMDNFDITTKTQITFFEDWSVRDIMVSANTDRIVFEHFKDIWGYDPATGEVKKIYIDILEDNFPNPLSHNRYESELTAFAVSPNQELLVFAQRYDMFAVPIKGGKVEQLTFDQRGIESIVIMNDNETIYFVSSEQGIPRLYKTNIKSLVNKVNNPIEKITWSNDKYITNIWADKDDNLYITYNESVRRRLISVMNRNGVFRALIPGEELLAGSFIAVPERNKIIYVTMDGRWNRTLKMLDTVTNETTVLFTGTNYIGSFTISEDKNILFYAFNGNINAVSLVNPRIESEDNWDKIVPNRFASGTQNLPPNDIWDINNEKFSLRNKLLTSDPGWIYPVFTNADSTLFYIQENSNNTVLKSIRFDGSKKEDIFNFRGSINSFYLTQDDSHLYYTLNNRLHKLAIKSKQSSPIEFNYRYSYDNTKLNRLVFEHVWGRFKYFFYDANMHGQDWEAIFEIFRPYIDDIKALHVLERFVDEMIGRVNASHTGFYPRSEGHRMPFTHAYAGFVPDFTERLPVGIKIKKIYFGSELYQNYGIRDNDMILEINGTPIHANTIFSEPFINQVNENMRFRIQTPRGIVNANIKGISFSEQSQLRYDDNVLNNYRTVTEMTDGRIGYLHIQAMDGRSLRKFEQDFLAVNVNTDAMIIDVRGNGGGRISHDLVDIIQREHYSFQDTRDWGFGINPNPSRIYQKPIVCLINEDSFSDAEIFGILFRDLNLGPVIGMPTSGSIIGTRQWDLIDGSSMRMPINGWYNINMVKMEPLGAVPDILVPNLPIHILRGEDPQLMRAIDVLKEMITD